MGGEGMKDIERAALADDTIMADGRPAFAWWNEIQMARQREPALERQARSVRDKAAILGCKEIRTWLEENEQNLIIYISRHTMMEGGLPEWLSRAKLEAAA